MTPPHLADLRGGDLVERLREIPVWMVDAMTPGWQDHGTAAYEAADAIQALLDLLDAKEARERELEAELERERQKVAWPAMYQRYWDCLARIKVLEGALSNLEYACDRVAATRSRETYLRMIDHDKAGEALEALDEARRAARLTLSAGGGA